jgi:DNA-binding NtrC family response regulator
VPIGTFAETERAIIQRALESTEGNKVQAARLLKISRKKLYAKIAKYGLR